MCLFAVLHILSGQAKGLDAEENFSISPVGGVVSGGHGGIEPPPTDQWHGTAPRGHPL